MDTMTKQNDDDSDSSVADLLWLFVLAAFLVGVGLICGYAIGRSRGHSQGLRDAKSYIQKVNCEYKATLL